MESPNNEENTLFTEDNGKKLRLELSKKIKEIEEMRENYDKHTIDEINNKLKEIKQLQKNLEEYHESIKQENIKKKNAIEELNTKAKELKRLQTAIEEEHVIQEEGIKTKEPKRSHKKYIVSINHTALKRLEGVTKNSFLALAKDVIMIDNKAYDENVLTLSKERKNDFKRLIEHYAVIEVLGKRKHHIKRVYDKKQHRELKEPDFNSTNESLKDSE